MNRTILYALFVLLAACAVFGASQMDGEAGEASVAVPVEQNEVVEGENEAVVEQEPQQPEVQQEQAAPDGMSRGLALKRSRSGSQGGPPAKKRPKWVVPVAIAAGLAVVTGLSIAAVFGVKHMNKSKKEKKDKKEKEEKDKKDKEDQEKADKDKGKPETDPTKLPQTSGTGPTKQTTEASKVTPKSGASPTPDAGKQKPEQQEPAKPPQTGTGGQKGTPTPTTESSPAQGGGSQQPKDAGPKPQVSSGQKK